MFRRSCREPEPIRFLDENTLKDRTRVAWRRREWPVGTMAFLVVLGSGLMLRGAGVWAPGGGVSIDEEIGRSFSITGTPRILVETFNGPIEVARGEPGTVGCLVVRRGSGRDREAAEADMRRVDVAIEQQGQLIRVIARRGGFGSWGDSGASIRLRVPSGSPARLETRNGPINVSGVRGPVHARSTNGRIGIRDGSGAVDLETSNGSIACRATEAVVLARVHNGSITFDGSLAPGRSSLDAHNGQVTLNLPGDQSFRIDAEAHHGGISSDFDIEPARGSRPHRKHLVGMVGHDPAVAIRARTHNGSIRIFGGEDEHEVASFSEMADLVDEGRMRSPHRPDRAE